MYLQRGSAQDPTGERYKDSLDGPEGSVRGERKERRKGGREGGREERDEKRKEGQKEREEENTLEINFWLRYCIIWVH